MKQGVVIADAGPIFSLAIIDKLEILDSLFDKIYISQAVWEEISKNPSYHFSNNIIAFFKDKVEKIKGFNDLTFVMDYGESESVILYQEIGADFLLIDDKKARTIAESLGINCIGILGLLMIAKDKKLIKVLKPIFETLIINKRFYSIELVNSILIQKGEKPLNLKKSTLLTYSY